jgi:hypothetical protein
MLDFFKKLLFGSSKLDYLVEGVWADQYSDPAVRQLITETYLAKYSPEPTPLTTPELYDPLAPPVGWRYDPYYEIWIQL